MKSDKGKYLAILILYIYSMTFFSCREEIISPQNNSGNINEPYRTSNQNSYTFILNAQNISQNIVDYPRISYFNSRIFISVLDHSAGSVEIVILTKSRDVLYRKRLAEENNGAYAVVTGIRPEIIEIYIKGFTGKLKFQLTGVL